jgi:hypothetical protein
MRNGLTFTRALFRSLLQMATAFRNVTAAEQPLVCLVVVLKE